jgi:hypothetical protein
LKQVVILLKLNFLTSGKGLIDMEDSLHEPTPIFNSIVLVTLSDEKTLGETFKIGCNEMRLFSREFMVLGIYPV